MKKKIRELLEKLEKLLGKIVYMEICTDSSGKVFRAGRIALFGFLDEEELIKKLKEAIGEAK